VTGRRVAEYVLAMHFAGGALALLMVSGAIRWLLESRKR
jgi:hypothetical protein